MIKSMSNPRVYLEDLNFASDFFLPVSFYRSLGSKQCWVIAVVIVAIVVGVIGIIVVVEIIVHGLASSINCIGV